MSAVTQYEGVGNRHGNLRQTVADERVRCICPSATSRHGRCKERATQEDGQCDACRDNCAPVIARK